MHCCTDPLQVVLYTKHIPTYPYHIPPIHQTRTNLPLPYTPCTLNTYLHSPPPPYTPNTYPTTYSLYLPNTYPHIPTTYPIYTKHIPHHILLIFTKHIPTYPHHIPYIHQTHTPTTYPYATILLYRSGSSIQSPKDAGLRRCGGGRPTSAGGGREGQWGPAPIPEPQARDNHIAVQRAPYDMCSGATGLLPDLGSPPGMSLRIRWSGESSR